MSKRKEYPLSPAAALNKRREETNRLLKRPLPSIPSHLQIAGDKMTEIRRALTRLNQDYPGERDRDPSKRDGRYEYARSLLSAKLEEATQNYLMLKAKNSPSTTPPSTSQLAKARIREIQEALNDLNQQFPEQRYLPYALRDPEYRTRQQTLTRDLGLAQAELNNARNHRQTLLAR